MTSSGDPPEVPPCTSSIVSQWQQLASTNRQSDEFILLLSSLTGEDNRSSTIKLCGTDARVVLTVMDEVIKSIRSGNLPSEYEHNTLNAMRKLASNSGEVPTHYQVDRHSLTVETDVIASGAFTDVRKGVLDGRAVAIKTLRNDRKVDKNKSQKIFCKESIIWMNFSHPNILRLIGVDIDSQTGWCSMISEMMVNGNVREYIRQNSVDRHRLLKEVAAGLSYLHERGIVHGDLKGSNILITNDTPPQACLADFGLATLAPSTEGATTTNTTGGTLLYMAPELLFPTKFGHQSARPTKPADIYALGMVIFEVLAGFQPFYERKWPLVEIFYHVMKGERPAKPSDAEKVGFGYGTWELVERCWEEEPMERPTVEQALTHLTKVTLSSTVVGPTSAIPPENSPEFDSTTEIQPLFGITSAIQRSAPATPSTVSTTKTTGPPSPRTSSRISSVSSWGSGDVKRNVVPSMSSLSANPTSRSPPRSKLAGKLLVHPEDILKSTIPMPIFFAKRSKRDRLASFFDALKPKHADGPSSPTHQIR